MIKVLADDNALMANTEPNLQNLRNLFHEYVKSRT